MGADTPSFESIDLHDDTHERLNELAGRVNTDGERLKEIANRVEQEADIRFIDFKEIFSTTDGNAFTGEVSDQQITMYFNVDDIANADERKLLRTELMARANDFFVDNAKQINEEIASVILEQGMAEWRHQGDTEKALYDAMRMVHQGDTQGHVDSFKARFLGAQNREQLATEMQLQPDIIPFAVIKEGFEPEDVEILVGGAMTNIDVSLLSAFTIKNVKVFDDDTFVAQMANGCEGNLVIGKLQPKKGDADPGKPTPTIPPIESAPDTTTPPIIGTPNLSPITPPYLPDGIGIPETPVEDRPNGLSELEPIEESQQIDLNILSPKLRAEFVRLNPNNHWVEYEELVNYIDELPPDEQVQLEREITLFVAQEAKQNSKDALKAAINSTSGNEKLFYQAQLNVLQGAREDIELAKQQLASITDKNLDTNKNAMLASIKEFEQEESTLERDLNGLSMFAMKVGTDLKDNTNTSWMQDKFEGNIMPLVGSDIGKNKLKNKETAHLYLNIIPELEVLLKTKQATNLDDAIIQLKNNPPVLISTSDIDAFKDVYDKTITNGLQGIMNLPKDQLDYSQMEKMDDMWLEMAKYAERQGDYDQAKEIYYNIFESALNPLPQLRADKVDEIKDSVSHAEIRRHLEASGVFEGQNITNDQQKTDLVEQAYGGTVETLIAEASLHDFIYDKPASECLNSNNGVVIDAFEKYQGIEGLGGFFDMNDEMFDEVVREIAITIVLTAVSGGIATGARLGATMALRGTRLANWGAKGRNIGKVGRLNGMNYSYGGVAGTLAEGAVFHQAQHGLLHGELDLGDNALRGMAMSALMFGTMRKMDDWLPAGLGSAKNTGRATPTEFLRGSGRMTRGAAAKDWMKNRFKRVTATAAPMALINGGMQGMSPTEIGEYGEEYGKAWTTLMLLSLLPGRKMNSKRLESPSKFDSRLIKEGRPIPKPGETTLNPNVKIDTVRMQQPFLSVSPAARSNAINTLKKHGIKIDDKRITSEPGKVLQEIKKRRSSLHPDRNAGANNKDFHEVQDAYRTLQKELDTRIAQSAANRSGINTQLRGRREDQLKNPKKESVKKTSNEVRRSGLLKDEDLKNIPIGTKLDWKPFKKDPAKTLTLKSRGDNGQLIFTDATGNRYRITGGSEAFRFRPDSFSNAKPLTTNSSTPSAKPTKSDAKTPLLTHQPFAQYKGGEVLNYKLADNSKTIQVKVDRIHENGNLIVRKVNNPKQTFPIEPSAAKRIITE
jgi:hypothetical protein